MARDMLDAELLTLCEELERAGALLSALPDAWPWFAQCGAPAPELIASIRGAAARGRAAHTETGAEGYALREAEAVGVELSEEALAAQSEARAFLAGILTVFRDEVQEEVERLRRAMTLRRARLQAAVHQWRDLRFLLQRPGARVPTYPAGQQLQAAVDDLAARLEIVHGQREDVYRAHGAARRKEEAVRVELVAQARHLRRVWEQARLWSNGAFPKLVFEQAKAEHVARMARRAAQAAAQAEAEASETDAVDEACAPDEA